MFRLKNQKGFTLLELLTVISIISLLANSVLATVSIAREKARDGKRFAQMNQFQKGLEIFYDDYGAYPCGDSQPTGSLDCSGSEPFLDGRKLASHGNGDCVGIGPTDGTGRLGGLYTAGILGDDWIKDPLGWDYGYGYTYKLKSTAGVIDQQTYILAALIEDDSELAKNDGGKCDNYYEIGNGVGDLTPSGCANPCN